mmetsp:Transcript_129731/g.416181  ORF Transcript_129731/g.416181 Transcript_129731/m.416181 type:complete len:232 (+) Transcript_129731:829-1524(+)
MHKSCIDVGKPFSFLKRAGGKLTSKPGRLLYTTKPRTFPNVSNSSGLNSEGSSKDAGSNHTYCESESGLNAPKIGENIWSESSRKNSFATPPWSTPSSSRNLTLRGFRSVSGPELCSSRMVSGTTVLRPTSRTKNIASAGTWMPPKASIWKSPPAWLDSCRCCSSDWRTTFSTWRTCCLKPTGTRLPLAMNDWKATGNEAFLGSISHFGSEQSSSGSMTCSFACWLKSRSS